MTRIHYLGLFAPFLVALSSCQLTDTEFQTVGTGTLEIQSTGEVVDLATCSTRLEESESSRTLFVEFTCPLSEDPFLEGRLEPKLWFRGGFGIDTLETREGTGDANLLLSYRDGMATKVEGCEGREPYEWRADADEPASVMRVEISILSGCASGDITLVREEI